MPRGRPQPHTEDAGVGQPEAGRVRGQHRLLRRGTASKNQHAERAKPVAGDPALALEGEGQQKQPAVQGGAQVHPQQLPL